jgi:C1A family cysteine protease
MMSVVIDGKERFLGNNSPIGEEPKKFRAVFGDSPNQQLYTRDQWKVTSYSKHIPEVLDQDGIGACNAFCTVQNMHVNRSQMGLPFVRLSPGYLYGCINGQRDEGSNLEDALNWMKDNGTVPQTMVDMLTWRKGQWPSGCAEKAKENRILEAFWCPTFDHCASAVMCGYTLNLGMWWTNSDNPDSNGWLPRSGRGGGGHSIIGIGLFPQPGRQTWGLQSCNSWGASFGQNGRFFIPEERLSGEMSSGMWAIAAASVEPTNLPPDLPPLVTA